MITLEHIKQTYAERHGTLFEDQMNQVLKGCLQAAIAGLPSYHFPASDMSIATAERIAAQTGLTAKLISTGPHIRFSGWVIFK